MPQTPVPCNQAAFCVAVISSGLANAGNPVNSRNTGKVSAQQRLLSSLQFAASTAPQSVAQIQIYKERETLTGGGCDQCASSPCGQLTDFMLQINVGAAAWEGDACATALAQAAIAPHPAPGPPSSGAQPCTSAVRLSLPPSSSCTWRLHEKHVNCAMSVPAFKIPPMGVCCHQSLHCCSMQCLWLW